MNKTNPSEDVLEIEDLIVNFYTYEGIVEALDGVHLSLRKGETLGLVGETGCGKTVTSLSSLILVPPPGAIERGNIYLKAASDELNLTELDDKELQKIRGKEMAMIFQEPRAALDPLFSVEKQIQEVLLIHRIEQLCERALHGLEDDLRKAGSFKAFIYKLEKNLYGRMLENQNSLLLRIFSRIPIVKRYQNRLKKEARKEAIRYLELLRIADPERVADMYPHELSGGMAQRVVIAMALCCDPRILLADEPTTNLDVTVQAQMLQQIRELKEKLGSSVLYVTHDLGVVAELCDRVAVMYAGNIIENADVFEIFRRPLHPYTEDLLNSIPRPGKEFKTIRGEVPALINPPSGCRYHPRCSKALPICQKEKPPLKEVEKDHFIMCHLYR